MKYKKITQEDVYRILVSVRLDIMAPIDSINLVNIASLLGTSRYQVKKYVDELKNQGMVELTSSCIPSDEELYPPYWGYRLTTKGENTDYFRKAERREIELIEECFG